MNENASSQADVERESNVSAIWLIPLIALAIGIWMLYQFVESQGPEIKLIMSDAAGIEVGKTEIKSLNVSVGVVTSVKFGESYDHIEVTAQMTKDAERMLHSDTLFWVVEPRIGKEGISGLETLLSGSYIQIQPGESQIDQDEFVVLDTPPVAPPHAKGIRVVLSHPLAGKLDIGDPVIYQGFTAGRVEKVEVDIEKKSAKYQLFIFEPFDELVKTDSRFWLNSGVDLRLDAQGFNVRIDSIEALIGGGVSFDVLDRSKPSQTVTTQNQEFTLYEDFQSVKEDQFDRSIEFIVMFDETLRGLTQGASVEFRGLKIGSVSKVPLRGVSIKDGFDIPKIPVLIKLEPQRVFEDSDNLSDEQLMQQIQMEFQKGLRARLSAGSLLTGALFIDVDYDEQAIEYEPSMFDHYPVFPDSPSELAEIQASIATMLNKVNELPLNETVVTLNRSLSQLETSLSSAQKVMDAVEAIVAQRDAQALPEELKDSLDKLQNTLDGFSANSTVYQNLDKALIELENTMKELQPVLQQINVKPNSLVFGEDSVSDPKPMKGKN
ncbi:intermembrane transport protein PqiB [Vibrio sp. RE88]|uniref:intermembrane transport protein PqiB n=1 Tax=Vibrio sp. RE88 TaxID=2607610 RepID=UPI0014936C1D|nr:intermembrane transport protein PqiB [Vibrio sp. RE88]NOH63115.1 intermembrane transport protein PqiB [Vibrio sp. RE88]